MKKHQINNNKIGSVYAAAKSLGLKPEKARDLLQIETTAELRSLWNYRLFGLKIKNAREALSAAQSRRSYDYPDKEDFEPYHFSPRVLDYLNTEKERDTERLANLARKWSLPEARSLDNIKQYTNGYGCHVKVGENDLLINRHEHVTWSPNRNRKWPESRTTSYSATLISEGGDTVAKTTFASRKGDWLKEIGIALGLYDLGKHKFFGTSAMIPVRHWRRHTYAVTEFRLFAVTLPIFCALEQRGRVEFNSSTIRDAVRGLFREMKASRMEFLDASDVVTLAKATEMGFCPIGIQKFLNALGWDGRSSATAGEIREAIRHIDVTPWLFELEIIGLIRNPENTN